MLKALGHIVDFLNDDRDQLLDGGEITLEQILDQLVGGVIDGVALFNQTVDEGAVALDAVAVRVEALVGGLEVLGEVDGNGEDGLEVLLRNKLSNLVDINDDLDEVNRAVTVGDGDSGIDDREGHGGEAADAEDGDEDVQELHL